MIDLKKEIHRLSEITSVTSHEFLAHGYFRSLCEGVFDEISTDDSGNLIAVLKSKRKNAKKLMIDAHLDEIGFIVTEITGSFLKLRSMGGIADAVLPACELVVHGKHDIPAVIASKPPHAMTDADREKLVPLSEMLLDTGYDHQQLIQLVSVGDTVGFKGGAVELLNGRLASKGLDDRLCALCVISAVQRAKETASYDVYACFSVQEETSSLGAITLAYSVCPDLAVAVDVTHAEHDGSKSSNPVEMSAGTAVSVSDTLSLSFARHLIGLANDSNIPLTVCAEPSYTGTNAHYIEISRAGVPTALVSLPIRYMHTPSEAVALSDCESTAQLLAKLISDGSFECGEVEIIG